MSQLKKLFILVFLFIPMVTVNAEEYVETQKDTRFITEKIDIEEVDLSEFTFLEENENFKFYFRDDRDIIAVYDKNNGYTWKSGLDIEFSKDIKSDCDDAYDDESLTVEERIEVCRPIEDRLNTTFTGIANSLITMEYFDATQKIKRISSASRTGGESELTKISDGKYLLEVRFTSIYVSLDVYIYFTDTGFDLEIKEDSITGKDVDLVSAIMLNPFMGASGGQNTLWNAEDERYNIDVPKEMIDGYVLVPDGSGALIRFNNYTESLKQYEGDVYGVDYAQTTHDSVEEDFFVPFKEPSMPVYGIAHGYRQAAFVGYATQGAEYMEVIVSPEENMTFYTWAYPKFTYRAEYYQVYNQKGDGFFNVFEEPNHFDIYMNYEFLSNGVEDGKPADYVGMAMAYREYLLNEQILEEQSLDEVSMRVDFLMSDSKESIFGYKNVIMTTVDQADAILSDIKADGIDNLSVGLMGWQAGGVTLQDPYKARFTRKIGTGSEFDELFETHNDIDISLVEEYVEITSAQVNIRNNAAKHINLQFMEVIKSWVLIHNFGYSSPEVAVEWMATQLEKLNKVDFNSFTYDGIGDNLYSDYKRDITVTDSIELYQEFLSGVNHDVNIVNPSQYLWQYTDRYLQTPMNSTAHLIETDTVPFLQLVVADSMELFAPYSNFSFSKQSDILRMIDYNVAPSFIITHESAHKMASTNSGEFYSTSYENYDEDIRRVYDGVSTALNKVSEANWVDREVIAEGVIKNTYDNGVEIIINYTDDSYQYLGEMVQAESYRVYG